MAYTNGDEEMVIMTIRAADVTVDLRRIPAGFYTAVRHSGLEWRTANRNVSVNDDTIQWRGPIPIPSDLSSTIRLVIYAPFEFQPVLSQGEALRELTVTVQHLLDRNAKGLPFAFSPMDGNVRLPCSSILVTLQRRRREGINPSVLGVLSPHCSITEPLGQLEQATDHGHLALSCYRKHREPRDLERSIDAFGRALDNCPLGHPCRAAAQSNLAMARFARCQADDSDLSLDVPITLYFDALAARPTGHPDRPSTLIQLATVHLLRFERQRDPVDAARAETLLHEAVDLCAAESHENQAAISALQLHAGRTIDPVHSGKPLFTEQDSASGLTDRDQRIMGVQLLRRFEQFGDLADLQRAISTLESSISDSVQDDRYSASLGNLGVALWYRFGHLGVLSDLEQAISKQRDAVDLTPDDHPDKPGRLNNLGNSLLTRFEHLGSPVDLERAISRHRDAIKLIPHHHPDKTRHLNNLGNSLFARFERLGGLTVLEEAISLYQEAIELTPDGNRNKLSCLNNLAASLRTRFRHLGELKDLEEAVLLHRGVIETTPDDNHNKHAYLINLATTLLTRFMRLGELSDLEQAISTHRQAIELTPDGRPDKPRRLNNLANSIIARFEHLGDLGDLEQALSGHGQAIELTPNSHPDKPRRLNNLANSYRARFERLGELSDLEQAISGNRRAIELAGPNRNYVYLNSLATSFLVCFKHLGNQRDLEEAILGYKKVVELTPDGNRNKPAFLDNLSTSLFIRFELLGTFDDLDQGISKLREAVALAAEGHSDKPNCLNNLAVCLRTRFTHFGQVSDLEEAISRHKEAVQLAPGGCRIKLNCRKNLGEPLFARSRLGPRSSQEGDLERAISIYKEAVQLTSDRHPDKCCRLNDLANCLLARFEHLGELSDLDEAAVMHQEAVRLSDSSSACDLFRTCPLPKDPMDMRTKM